MNKIMSFAVPVLTVVVGVWIASVVPNPLARFTQK